MSVSAPVRSDNQILQGIAAHSMTAALRQRRSFHAARPFPHAVWDGLFDRHLLEQAREGFDAVGAHDWNVFENRLERKLGTRPGRALPAPVQRYFDLVYSGPFIRWLSALTDIPWLLGDPWLFGGGMHMLPAGGHFQVHHDFERHPSCNLESRLVLLTFLNPGWQAEWGGALELWERDGSACALRILPEMGRTVLFATPDAPHGVPDPVRTPDCRPRLSLAAYYYTGASPLADEKLTTTRFVSAGEAERRDELKWLVKRCMPPIMLDGLRSAFAKRGGR